MAVITISKECGTESCEVARAAAEKLGYLYIGRELISEIAQALNMSDNEAKLFLKRSQARILRFANRYVCTTIQKVVDRERGCLDDDTYHDCTSKLVCDLYRAGDAIILGWGGQCILGEKSDVLHVRLTMPEEAKIRAVMARKQLERKVAEKHIRVEEGDSRKYVKHFPF